MTEENQRYYDPVPRPPPLRPTWTTWMWLGFAVLALILTVLGLLRVSSSY